MNTRMLLPLFLALSLLQPASAQPPPRHRPIPPAVRPRPPVVRPVIVKRPVVVVTNQRPVVVVTNERVHRSGGQLLPSTEIPDKFKARSGPQIGANFIRFFWSEERPGKPIAPDSAAIYQPDRIFRDLRNLGVATIRQFVKADLLWDVVEPDDGQWTFSNADTVLSNGNFVYIPTLFRMQYASPTPPWETDPAHFQKTIGPEARTYLETVVRRYAPYVKYWEIGNEMEHWRAADPGDGGIDRQRQRVPRVTPADGFSPREQGKFLAQAAAVIRANDPDAVIVLPGMTGLDDYSLNTWLPGVIEGGGRKWFDVVNYHFYSGWEGLPIRRQRLAAAMKRLGIEDKPVWQTETGSSSDATLVLRTDYPNSPETQAADVFRRIVQGYGHGDSLVLWHCYIPSPSASQNEWRAYGLRDPQGTPTLAGHAFQLLAGELLPWTTVERLEADPRGRNLYRFTLADGAQKIVAWGKGSYTVPNGITQTTSVIPDATGGFHWQSIQPGTSLPLFSNPILLK